MGFGLSFGASKSKSETTKNIDTTATENQTQNQTKASDGTTTATGTSAQQSAQQGTSAQQGATTAATQGQQTTASTVKSFTDQTLDQLNSAVSSLFAKTLPGAGATMPGSFDHAAFVNDSAHAVEQKANTALDTGINSMYDAVGGRDNSNSMVALLANQARADTGAVVGGARASAEAQAQQIEQARFAANQGAQGQTQNFLANILQSLKGGTTSSTGQATTAETQAGTSSQTGQTATSGSQTGQTASDQHQTLSEVLASILSGITHTVGTETDKTKGSNMGGGASLSI